MRRALSPVLLSFVVLLAGCAPPPYGGPPPPWGPPPGGPPPPPPGMCGGIGGFACGPGQFCMMPVGQCRRPDAAGACRPRPEVCTREYAPVCGCDGRTYGNTCEAHSAGVSVLRTGPC